MKAICKKELALSVALLIVVFLLINPFGMFMTSTVQMIVLALLVAVMGAFAGLVVSGTISDERDYEHNNLAGRVGYVSGLVVVLLGIVVQALQSQWIDRWLLVALFAMVMVKIVSRAYSRRFR